MKNMDAILVTLARAWHRRGRAPRRDIVLAFIADEERGGEHGSQYLIERHPGRFADCTAAISEVGGFSVTINDAARLYLIQTAEKGLHWLMLRAHGAPGHGSMVHTDNAVVTLSEAVSRIGRYQFPVSLTPEMTSLLRTLSDVVGTDLNPEQPETWLPRFGGLARMIGAALRNTANLTGLRADSRAPNVVPGDAQAGLDMRFVPGGEESTLATLRELAGDRVDIETIYRADAVASPYETDLVEAMGRVLVQEDPAARPAPFLLSAGTDAKSFARLGLNCYGFVPLKLEPGLDFAALFHGVDERISHDALHFGLRVLNRLLLSY
jgi:acetylornithine deacetylase/succinyl-diaminopimelate desuccinylase-like protein